MENKHQNSTDEPIDVNNNLEQTNVKNLTPLKKNKKGRFKLLSFIIISVVMLITFIVVIVVLRNQVTQFEITIDPVIVTHSQENHINGAQKLLLDVKSLNSQHETSIEATLRNEEYMYYRFTMKNLSKSTIKTTLKSEIYSFENVDLSYSVNNGPRQELTSLIDETIFHSGESKSIKIYVSVIDPNYDSHVKGKLILLCSEEKVG